MFCRASPRGNPPARPRPAPRRAGLVCQWRCSSFNPVKMASFNFRRTRDNFDSTAFSVVCWPPAISRTERRKIYFCSTSCRSSAGSAVKCCSSNARNRHPPRHRVQRVVFNFACRVNCSKKEKYRRRLRVSSANALRASTVSQLQNNFVAEHLDMARHANQRTLQRLARGVLVAGGDDQQVAPQRSK